MSVEFDFSEEVVLVTGVGGALGSAVAESFLAAGAIGAQRFALILYTLPISLFGLSVAAAELPDATCETTQSDRTCRACRFEECSSFSHDRIIL